MRDSSHRLLLAPILAGALVAPALAQPLRQPSFQQSMDLEQRSAQIQAQQNLANRQLQLQQNQLDVQQSELRTQQAIEDIQRNSVTPTVPPLIAPLPGLDASDLASIPDDTLARSNQRVLDAAGDHH